MNSAWFCFFFFQYLTISPVNLEDFWQNVYSTGLIQHLEVNSWDQHGPTKLCISDNVVLISNYIAAVAYSCGWLWKMQLSGNGLLIRDKVYMKDVSVISFFIYIIFVCGNSRGNWFYLVFFLGYILNIILIRKLKSWQCHFNS